MRITHKIPDLEAEVITKKQLGEHVALFHLYIRGDQEICHSQIKL